MTELALTVDADDELWTLDELPVSPYVEVGTELIEVRALFPSGIYSLTGQELPPRMRVRRAVGGTTAAGHNSGSTLTPIYGLGSGGGGGAIAVTDGSTTVEDVTTLNVVGVSEIAPGEAEIVTFPFDWGFDESAYLAQPDVIGPGILLGDEQGVSYIKLTPYGFYRAYGDDAEFSVMGDADFFDFAVSGGANGFYYDPGVGTRFQVKRDGSVLLPGLPTADPTNAGQLWNDTGTLKVSAG